ncbi:MAG: restriction endonuclease subunit S [Muribaculaceae bacterium]|nr:restriction endonuclease subunit S [Muribaculaceae bacterium]
MEIKTVKLGEIAEFANGLNFDKSAYRAGVKIIGVSDFKDYSIPIIDSLAEVAIDAVKESARLKENDIIFVRSNGNKDLVGRCMIIPHTSEKLYFSGFCIRCRFKNTIYANPRYFLYLFKSPSFRRQLSNTSVGANIQNLSQSRLAMASVPLPPKEVQDKIASILSAYDDMIDNCKKQIAFLEEAAQRLYREWFVDLRFPGHETTSTGENGLPDGWSFTTLDNVADIIMGQSPASSFYNNEKIGLPFHQGVSSFGNIYVVNNTYTSKWTKEAPANSILFSVRAPVGRINLTLEKIALGRGVASIKHKDNMQPFLYHHLKHFFYKDDVMGNGTIFSSINKEQLKNVKVLNPSDITMRMFCDMVRTYDNQLAIIDKELRNLVEVRDMLLPRLISGQIEINV